MALVGIAFSACKDDDVPVAKAVLCSAFQLNYEATNPQSQEVKVVSDGVWHLDHCSDWVTISPETGNGTTMVTVTVAPNFENGIMQRPRRGEFVIKGGMKMSEAQVVILQAGDDFLGVATYTIPELAITPDESPVVMPELTVVAALTNSLVVSDGSAFLYVDSKPEGAVMGARGTFKGYKYSDAVGNPYLQVKEFEFKDNAEVTLPAPEVIKSFKGYEADVMKYVQVEGGHIDAGRLYIEEEPEVGVFVDTTSDIDLNEIQNKVVVLKGFYLGTQGSNIRLIATEVEVLGNYQTVYFREDWEWLDEWSVASGVGATVETDNPDATATALTSIKTTVDGKEITCFDYIESKGYKFVYDKGDNKRTYLQRNYLKFGKTGNHSGITLPAITNIPADAHVVMSFDWCPMRQGSGKIDPVTLFVEIKNGEDVRKFDIPTHSWENDHVLEWIKATVDLKGVKIDKDTKITISQNEFDASTANRWFLDNIKIVEVE